MYRGPKDMPAHPPNQLAFVMRTCPFPVSGRFSHLPHTHLRVGRDRPQHLARGVLPVAFHEALLDQTCLVFHLKLVDTAEVKSSGFHPSCASRGNRKAGLESSAASSMRAACARPITPQSGRGRRGPCVECICQGALQLNTASGSKNTSRAKGMHRKLGGPTIDQRQCYALARIGKARSRSR
jgi:hypothetical protein